MKYVVVIGSKPETKLPVVDPVCVYTASGAAPRGLYYREKFGTKLSAIITHGVFKMQNETVLNAVQDTKPDEIVLRCTENKFADPSGFLEQYSQEQIIYVRRPMQYKIQKKLLGFKLHIAVMQRDIDLFGKIKTLMDRIIKPRILRWRKPAPGCSTGLWTAVYALTMHPNATIIISGIGLRAGEHFYPDDRFDFSAIMGRVDSYFVKHLPQTVKDRLRTTEERMHTVGGIKMWEGDSIDV